MANQIALKLLNWVAGFGPAGGDQYDQERIDQVCDFLNGEAPSPVDLTREESEFMILYSEDVGDAWEELHYGEDS